LIPFVDLGSLKVAATVVSMPVSDQLLVTPSLPAISLHTTTTTTQQPTNNTQQQPTTTEKPITTEIRTTAAGEAPASSPGQEALLHHGRMNKLLQMAMGRLKAMEDQVEAMEDQLKAMDDPEDEADP
jgi:hypothetical protein